ncbi:SAF domain-containing protein [Microbacterium sp. RD1]|uniref:SAF domain-containing protein n=1 Tax=Microbacterium sp. RD1 TaxID=3457313 RepID=UPI003FA58308
MAAVDSPRARARPFWGDTRFVLGLVLIAASIAGVWLVVTAARQTAPVLAAARTIVPGEVIGAGDLRPVEVALGASEGAYLAPDTLPEGAVAIRTIQEGELVPSGALGTADDARVTTIVIDTAVDVPAAVAAGSRVELWFAPPAEDQRTFAEPRILVADATVVSVAREEEVIGSAGAGLELVIPRADVAAALAAVADGSALSVVPVSGAAS